ncbi:MAG: nickel pincer cofactor biosynthesis protein LarB [Magnetococcales bacterium]|nr:nickel pincer cofactor biosynthesis protein LarB [Magnetococcales bacterium]
MSPHQLKKLFSAIAAGNLSVEEALERFKRFPIDEVHQSGDVVARLDTHRELRHGFPEVIMAQGKAFSHLRRIVGQALKRQDDLLITRLSSKRRKKLRKRFPQLKRFGKATCLYRQNNPSANTGLVAVLCAGTSDISVADEAALTAQLMGAEVVRHYDAGVAGLHRLLAAADLLMQAHVFVVVAGMEGALPSVVGGLVDKPVIAVPTSQGYGASFQGLSALLGMLNSCTANVTVVNIDNGFGAGYVAGSINRMATSGSIASGES